MLPSDGPIWDYFADLSRRKLAGDVKLCQKCGRRAYHAADCPELVRPRVTRERWIELYGGQELLNAEGFDVVECKCDDDPACKGWRVERRKLKARVS